MSGFNDFVTIELPKRPFVDVDGAAGQVLVRSTRPERVRELEWADFPAIAPGVSLPAGASGILGNRAVMLASNGTLNHVDPAFADAFVGISKNSAVAGDLVSVATRDTVSEPTWTWTPGLPVFAGDDGVLTQTPPVTVCVAHIGVAINPTTLLLSKTQPVFLGA